MAWRHCGPEYDPSSGAGAWWEGGRFNPKGVFTVYLCTTRSCAVAEYDKQVDRALWLAQNYSVPVAVPRKNLYRYSVDLGRVLDLTIPETRKAVGVPHQELMSDDHRSCRAVGREAYLSGLQAVVSFSSTGQDNIMAVFVGRTKPDSLSWELREEWPAVSY